MKLIDFVSKVQMIALVTHLPRGSKIQAGYKNPAEDPENGRQYEHVDSKPFN